LSAKLSVEEVLASLEAQMAFHEERAAHHDVQAAFHREQEAFHRDRRDLHVAEHEAVARQYEAFKAAAGPAVATAARAVRPEPPPQEPPKEEPPVEEPPLKGLAATRSRLVRRWVAELPAGEVFGPSRAAAEVNRRFHRHLSKPADIRVASSALRRLLAEGAIRLAQRGTAHHEALYTKG
jgi:hypothetical protein